MGPHPLKVAQASQPLIEQVIKSLQQLRHTITARNVVVNPEISVADNQWDRIGALNIGLAISGGVDSMALAYLCSRLQAGVVDPARLRFRAFVVDHGVRSTSKEEACSVAKILESQNIPTSVLKIHWPAGLDPQASPKFESLARTFRFQALGRACRDHNIDSLFLAHHEDDQAETLLMRLAKGHRKSGLLGMNASGPIPECHGIYGVDRCGGKHQPRILSSISSLHLECEDGGVMVHRPLLNFTKAQLREVCEKNSVPWFEDHTNTDPRITIRNAIRHVYSKHQLPAALQKPSLLAMLERLQKQKEAIKLQQVSWPRKLRVQLFDERLPLLVLSTEALSQQEVSDDKAIPMLLDVLRKTIHILSPEDDIEVVRLLPVLFDMFPELRSQAPQYSGSTLPPQESRKYNRAGVQFTRQSDETARASSAWLLTPQKAYRNRAPYLRIPSRPTASLDVQAKEPESWHLWDGRYWINVCNRATQVLCLQQLGSVEAGSPDVVEHNRKLLRQLKHSMGKAVSGHWADWRHALATLTIEVDGKSTGRIIAFPTLGIVDDEYKGRVEWLVRYKKLE